MKTDARIDAYIEDKAADFARPILRHLRAVIHEACPDCEETLKWGMPAFLYKGQILAGMASFKAHATFHYWLGNKVVDTGDKADTGMGQFGRLTSVDDLPDRETLLACTRKAMQLTDEGVRPARASGKPPFAVPQDLQAAIDAEPAAKVTWDAFPPSCRREYVEWLTEAKREETRTKRLHQTIAQLREGKRRYWKYENC